MNLCQLLEVRSDVEGALLGWLPMPVRPMVRYMKVRFPYQRVNPPARVLVWPAVPRPIDECLSFELVVDEYELLHPCGVIETRFAFTLPLALYEELLRVPCFKLCE